MDLDSEEARAAVDQLHARLKQLGRGCGTCQACCTIMRVDMEPVQPVSKPERVRCGHLCSAGCKIYDAKPRSCSEFMCLWLASELFDNRMAKEWRPDRVGAVVDVNNIGVPTAHLKHEDRWRREGPLRDMLLWIAQGNGRITAHSYVILERPSGNHVLFHADGSAEDLIPIGVGENGLKHFRTRHPWEMLT